MKSYTRTELVAKIEKFVEKYVKHYKSDFYNYDKKTLLNPNQNGTFLLMLRDNGTYMFQTKAYLNKILLPDGTYIEDEEVEKQLYLNRKYIETVENLFQNLRVYEITLLNNSGSYKLVKKTA